MNPNDHWNYFKGDLSFEDFVLHEEAFYHLSNRSLDTKLKAIPNDTREKIGNVYKKMRERFYYPNGFDFERKEIKWLERVTKKEAYIRWHRDAEAKFRKLSQAPPSLAEMEPQDQPEKENLFLEIMSGLKQVRPNKRSTGSNQPDYRVQVSDAYPTPARPVRDPRPDPKPQVEGKDEDDSQIPF
ncbi:MAG: hypothetical protein ABIJ57_12070 [Pseudomonadota bacterium]